MILHQQNFGVRAKITIVSGGKRPLKLYLAYRQILKWINEDLSIQITGFRLGTIVMIILII